MLNRLRESPWLLALWIMGLLVVAAAFLAIGLVVRWPSDATAAVIVGAVAAYLAVSPAIDVVVRPEAQRRDARIRHAIAAGPHKVKRTAPVLLQALHDEAHVAEVLAVLGQSDKLDAIKPDTRKELRKAVVSRVQSKDDDAALQVLEHMGIEDGDVEVLARALPNPRALELLTRIPTQHAADTLVSFARALPNPRALDLLTRIPTQHAAETLADRLTDSSDQQVLEAIAAYAGQSAQQRDHMREVLEARYQSDNPKTRRAVMQAWYRLGDVARLTQVVTKTPLPSIGDDPERHKGDVAEAVVMLDIRLPGFPEVSEEEAERNAAMARAALGEVLLRERDDGCRTVVLRELKGAGTGMRNVGSLKALRVKDVKQRQREIDRELKGRDEWYLESAADAEIAALASRGITAHKAASNDKGAVHLHIPVDETRKNELNAESDRLADELTLWQAFVE
jgi:hypothetical protein